MVLPVAMAGPAMAQSIHGTATYPVRARIVDGGLLVFTSDASHLVLTQAHGTTVWIVLRRAASGPPGSPAPSASLQPRSSRPLEKTYWKAIELDGKPVSASGSTREVYIILGGAGRVGGSDGCNRIIGSYTLSGDGIGFGALAGTQMACPDAADTERGLRRALSDAARWSIAGDRLELLDATGRRLGEFEAVEGRDR